MPFCAALRRGNPGKRRFFPDGKFVPLQHGNNTDVEFIRIAESSGFHYASGDKARKERDKI